MDICELAALPGLEQLVNIAKVAVGLGLVIFFHELGHFAVAKWCDVMVERFSIGFGPILFRKKWGETEYALSAIPFGGYVKMLGQDDIDPGQMTDDQVAADPRSYTAKTVPQRMAIISAGVIMNIATGLLFFAFAFQSGIRTQDRQVGGVRVGKPAWVHGLREGDNITSMNGRKVEEFHDVLRQTALSRGPISVNGKHADGSTFSEVITPDPSEIRRMLGIAPQRSLIVPTVRDAAKTPVTVPGTPAASAGFLQGDEITAVNGHAVTGYLELVQQLSAHRSEEVTLTVKRTTDGKEGTADLKLAPEPMKLLGLRMSIGRITHLRKDSPAMKADIQKLDQITHVDGKEVGREIDPMRLPEYFSDRAGKEVTITLNQHVKGGEPRSRDVTLVPEPRLASLEMVAEGDPLPIDAIGVAVDVLANIVQINPEGPASTLGVQPGDSVVSLQYQATPGSESSKVEDLSIPNAGWPYVFQRIQNVPGLKEVTLKIKRPGSDALRTVTIQPGTSTDWFQGSTRGLFLEPLVLQRKAESFGKAMEMSVRHTRNSMLDIYLTLRNLITGDLSVKSLHGPIGIAKTAYVVADQGLSDFLMFLGLISVNLAVINFLPIPVLDGGHMVFLLWEGIARKKPSEKVLIYATFVGFAFVIFLMVTVIYVDLFVTK